MTGRKILFIIFIIFFNADLYSQDNSVVIYGFRVFDGEFTISKTNVVVRDGFINSIGPSVEADDLPQIDGKGFTMVPGFINALAHTESIEQLNVSLRFGVTTVLDMGPFPRYDKILRDAAASKKKWRIFDYRVFLSPQLKVMVRNMGMP